MVFAFLHFPPHAVHDDHEGIARLPPSARAVFHAIVHDGPATHAELRQRTGLPARTVRFAVHRLRDSHFVDSRMSLHDSRNVVFFVHPRLIEPSAIERQRERAAHAGRLIERIL